MAESGLVVVATFSDYDAARVAAARLRSAGIRVVMPNEPGGIRNPRATMMPSITHDNYGYLIELLVPEPDADAAAALLDVELTAAAFGGDEIEDWSRQVEAGESPSARHLSTLTWTVTVVLYAVLGIGFVLVVLIVLTSTFA